MGVTAEAASYVRKVVSEWPENPGPHEVNELLRLLGRWRSLMLANTYISHQGARIWGGPFAGMEYVAAATEGALIPRLLGTYESELHPHLAAFASEVDCVIDIGCAEGYYAVGLARLMPSAQVFAFDISETARRRCADLAERNGVSNRVIVGGEFRPRDFQAFAGRRALVMVDAEGAEVDILDPAQSPALKDMNLIVETHDVYRQGALETMLARFSPSHDVVRVDQQPKSFEMPGWLQELPHLDQLLAVWEWRARPTPWLVMRPKAA